MDFYKKLWLNKEKELAKENRLVNKYMKELEKINKDPEFREYMTLDEDYRKIRNSILHEEKEKSREEGKKEGFYLTAKNMLKINMEPKSISEVTGISIEEIEELKKDL